MASVEHNHYKERVLKTNITTVMPSGKEIAEIYYQCSCGRVWKEDENVEEGQYF